MSIQIALLRGVNVGAHNRVPMADLRKLLADELGYAGARTLLQSGNVVVDAKVSAQKLARELEGAILERFDVRAPVIVRTREELAAVLERDPLGGVAEQPKLYQVSFLSEEPAAEKIAQIEVVDVTPERFVHIGREIYAWHPRGIHSSPLARLLSDRRLGVTATARNWNTLGKLLQMADEQAG